PGRPYRQSEGTVPSAAQPGSASTSGQHRTPAGRERPPPPTAAGVASARRIHKVGRSDLCRASGYTGCLGVSSYLASPDFRVRAEIWSGLLLDNDHILSLQYY